MSVRRSTAAPRLMIVTDRHQVEDLVSAVEPWLARAEPGSVVVQLRDHELSARARLALGGRLRAITQRYGQRLIVNDRLDIARLIDADGVHLGEQSVAASEARAWLGPQAFITRAWHPPGEPESTGVDALVMSPVFEPRKGREPLGLAGLQANVRRVEPIPVYALGGVSAERAPSALVAGAVGVAAIGAVLRAPSPEPLLRALGCCRA